MMAEIPVRTMITIVITRDRQPRSFRWAIRRGVNSYSEVTSRANADASHARRDAERVFGPLRWMEGAEAGADERNVYVVWVARVPVG